MKNRLATLLVLMTLALLLGACSNESTDKKENKVVAKVNGESIKEDEYKNELELTSATYEQQGMSMDEMDAEMKDQVEAAVLDQLINTKLVLQTAEKDGIKIGEKQINEEMGKVKSQFEDDAEYKAALKENKLTEEKFNEQIKQQLTINAYLEQHIGEVKVSEEEVKGFYDQYKEQAAAAEQETPPYEEIKPQLEEQVIAQKKTEKVNELIENLRKDNEKNIEVLL